VLIVNDRIKVPLRELQFTFARSQGPGGQNVNKVNTKATLRWSVRNNVSLPEDVRQRFLSKHRRRITKDGDLVLTSQRFRDQGRNIADCVTKLKELLAVVAEAPTQRKATKPSKGSRVRRRRLKEAISRKKQSRRGVGEND
jgi:ribosome-associated protein